MEYKNEPSRIAKDIGACPLTKRATNGWTYPNMEERSQLLRLNWVTYEELFQQMPDSELRAPLTNFLQEHGTIEGAL
jgi:hypothetical protein